MREKREGGRESGREGERVREVERGGERGGDRKRVVKEGGEGGECNMYNLKLVLIPENCM